MRGCSACTAVHDLGHFEQRHQIELAPAEVRKASGRYRRVHGYLASPRQYVNLASSSIFQIFRRSLTSSMHIYAPHSDAIGSIRYFRVQKALISGKFPPAHKTVIFVSTVLAVLVAVLFGVLVAVPRR